MSGKCYKNSIKLERAWGDGRRAAVAGAAKNTNPHTANYSGSAAEDAWNDGWDNIRT
jgi:ribosome modulation factor